MVMRRGGAFQGCLVMLLGIVLFVYLAMNAGEAALRYFRFRDAMQQEVRFAGARSDDVIKRHLQSVADSLGLPEEAHRIHIARDTTGILIAAEYVERIKIAWLRRDLRFEPRAEARF